MSNPAASVTRIFRFGSRFSLSKNTRTLLNQSKILYHSLGIKNPGFYGPYKALPKHLIVSPVRAMSALSPSDPSSYSRPELAVIRHVGLTLDIDFDKKVLHGSALLNFEALQSIDEVVLDASSQTIEAVELENGTALKYKLDGHIPNFGSRLTIHLPQTITPPEKKVREQSASESVSLARSKLISLDNDDFMYKMSEAPTAEMKTSRSFYIERESEGCSCDCCCGELPIDNNRHNVNRFNSERERTSQSWKDSLNIDQEKNARRPSGTRANNLPRRERFAIRVKYTTDPSASALQWLEPSQTSGKVHPYLFSQCQPIHARTILPCQDTPSVKFSYDAEVSAPEPFTVLMSALTKERQANRTTFHQPVPIPSYLLALAVGVLERRAIGPRTTVWSEKEEIDRSAWEFAETENYLQAAERLCGPYVWGQYDLLVLPPSFPYGGMENPCLTFVTPTLLAGDRSQADVIVHEIMHSWTGNLVTNRNFEHFWLNEGFTVFLERKVAASLISNPVEAKRSRDFHSLLGLQELTEAVTEQFTPNNPLTRLVPNLSGVHPDDAFSRVPYEKGSLFLRYLEDLVGGPEVFDDFLRSYLNNFQRRSLDTDQFKAYLLGYFTGKPAQDKLAQVQWDQWLYTPGMPPTVPNYDTSMTKAITNLLETIDKKPQFSPDDVKGFTPHQIINFLQEMINRPPLPADKLEELGAAYKITDSHNSEIRYRWLRLCVKSRVLARIPEVLQFVNEQGRMKFVRPLYRDMYAWEEVRERAIANFLEHERRMMHVSAYTVRKDLHLNENLLAQQ